MKAIPTCFFTFFLLVFIVSQTFAQEVKWIGSWSGKLDISSTKLEVIFEIGNSETGNPIAVMDVPMQGAKDIQCKVIKAESDSLILSVPQIMGSFSGVFENDTTLQGEWKQSGMKFPLTLTKTRIITELKRPQTPKEPFPYLSEEVEYINPKSGLKLAGTLTYPENAKNCPAVVLITGSGAQDRDESIFEHKPFLVIADYLTRNGIAVLRVDDRGVGGSEGNISNATSEDFAGDVQAGVQFLKTKSVIDPAKIGLIGHSEGGIIAPMVAVQSPEIAFVVLLAGPGINGEQILYAQGDLINRAAGVTDEQVIQNHNLQKSIFEILINEKDSIKQTESLQKVFSNGMYYMMNDDQKKIIDSRVKSVNSAWFRFFLTYDPYPTLVKLKCPVLALNGSKDLQVPPKENLVAIEKALTEGKNSNFKIMELTGLNHLFQSCKTGTVAEYAEIEETISPVVLEILKDWISVLKIKN